MNNLPAYVFHHVCEAIKDNTKHRKKNVPYVRLLYDLFHQSMLIETLLNLGVKEYMEMIYGYILLVAILGNMNIIKNKDVIYPLSSLRIRNDNTKYINDFPSISKIENPEVIIEYIRLTRKETEVSLTMGDIPDAHEGSVYRPPRKRK